MDDVLKPLEVQEGSFLTLISQGAVYVDKTAMILDLLRQRGPYFISRPRRFGKSLLLDTIQQIFEGKRELFAGLEIEKRFPDYNWAPTPVIRIDMNYVSTDPEKFETSLISKLIPIAESYGFQINKTDLPSSISDLILKLSKLQETSRAIRDNLAKLGNGNVVLLIDECDFPLIENLQDADKIEAMGKLLRLFYSALKGSIDNLRFLFITGITKFKQLSLFFSLNNVKDISFDNNFSTLCGFTEEEIDSYYGRHLLRSLKEQIHVGELPAISNIDSLKSKIKYWYDGYSWDGEKHVYNPYAIKSFLETGLFDDYWYKSGSPLLNSLLETVTGNLFAIFGNRKSIDDLSAVNDVFNINDEVFLLQAGYLTVDSIKGYGKYRTYYLKIPNNEIKDTIGFELIDKFERFLLNLKFGDTELRGLHLAASTKDILLSALWSRDCINSEMYLASIFSGISKDLSRNGVEYYYHIIILVILRFGEAFFNGDAYSLLSELLSDYGESDPVFEVPGGGYLIIELKFVPNNPSLEILNGFPTVSDITSAPYSSGLVGQRPQSPLPVGVTGLIEQGKISERLKLHLESQAEEAFERIRIKSYPKQLFVSRKPILAAAVVIYRTSTVLVRFKEIRWLEDSRVEHEIGTIRLPIPEESDTDL
ncbi:MAG: AAA family ATPase [Deltaproteobacteria bacterium]|nr:AAA family ATPase [Deltaproteobacteria bacterium]